MPAITDELITIYPNFKKHRCSVVDNKGNHCPEEGTIEVTCNENKLYLCEKCFKYYMNKTFGGISVSCRKGE